MDEDEIQQFCLRWHNHQSSVVGALGRMLRTGALADVTLSAGGAAVRAHRLVLASCSHYFAQLFKEVDCENNTLVVVLGCEAAELRLLLTFMYTGEVTASRRVLPALLRLAHTLQVSGLTDADTDSIESPLARPLGAEAEPCEDSASPINLDTKADREERPASQPAPADGPSGGHAPQGVPLAPPKDVKEPYGVNFLARHENDRLSKLDQIVRNLYSTHKIGHPSVGTPAASAPSPPTSTAPDPPAYASKYRGAGSVCSVCNKRLSNQYNLRVHMETHAGRRHACRACAHVSRSRDALRKHVAYRHARPDADLARDL